MRIAMWTSVLALAACTKSDPNAAADAGAKANADAMASVEAGATADAGTKGNAEAASFKGTYTAKPAALYIPSQKDYGSVKQAKSDDTKLVGEGTLAIEVGGGGRVTGVIDSGPAAPAVIDATKDGDEIRGTVRRKNPEDMGLTGVILGKLEGGKLTGTLTLAEANAAILRDAAFTAEKK